MNSSPKTSALWAFTLAHLQNKTKRQNPPSSPTESTLELVKTFTETVKQFSDVSGDQNSQHDMPKKDMSNDNQCSTPPSPQNFFNVNAPPPDVQQRCDTKIRGELLAWSEMKPFRTDIPEVQNPSNAQAMQCHLDPPATGNQLITKDGTAISPTGPWS